MRVGVILAVGDRAHHTPRTRFGIIPITLVVGRKYITSVVIYITHSQVTYCICTEPLRTSSPHTCLWFAWPVYGIPSISRRLVGMIRPPSPSDELRAEVNTKHPQRSKGVVCGEWLTIDSLVFPLLISKCVLLQRLHVIDVFTCTGDHSFGAIAHQVVKQ